MSALWLRVSLPFFFSSFLLLFPYETSFLFELPVIWKCLLDSGFSPILKTGGFGPPVFLILHYPASLIGTRQFRHFLCNRIASQSLPLADKFIKFINRGISGEYLQIEFILLCLQGRP